MLFLDMIFVNLFEIVTFLSLSLILFLFFEISSCNLSTLVPNVFEDVILSNCYGINNFRDYSKLIF